MGRVLPPLNWVRAFEAAARHEGFLKAGEELGVSAGAVSQQVKQLEGRLGVRLFERHPRGVRLTEAGATYRDALGPALDRIAAATDSVAAAAGRPRLRIAALPALAEKWLTPRLPGFQERHPNVSVEVSVAESLDGAAAPFDLGIHYNDAGGPGTVATPLFRDRMSPVCAPALAREMKLKAPEDLLRCRLLYDTKWAEDWTAWFAAAGLPAGGGQRDSGFTLYSMAVEAACEGLGVAMGHHALVARELDSGRLVAPFAVTVPVPHRYAAIVAGTDATPAPVARFIDWLLGEAASGGDQ